MIVRSTIIIFEVCSSSRKYFLQFADLNNLALDGKFLKGSDIHGQYINKSNQNIVNILDKTNKICIGHSFVSNKKNEIPAVQELLQEQFIHQWSLSCC